MAFQSPTNWELHRRIEALSKRLDRLVDPGEILAEHRNLEQRIGKLEAEGLRTRNYWRNVTVAIIGALVASGTAVLFTVIVHLTG